MAINKKLGKGLSSLLGNKEDLKTKLKEDKGLLLIPIEKKLNSIVNYETIVKDVTKLTKNKHYELLETLAEDIFFISATACKTRLEWPWAVSITIKSTPASINAEERSRPVEPTLEAAATRSLPILSLAAFGFKTACSKSFNVTKPVN